LPAYDKSKTWKASFHQMLTEYKVYITCQQKT
jgi:hypothetical protein